MSHTEPQPKPTDWWDDPNLVTYADMINAGMLANGIASQNQLADHSMRLKYGRGGRGIDRSVFSNLVSGRRREPQEHTLRFLSEFLGGPLWRWRQAAPSAPRLTRWKPPAEANSRFATQRTRNVHSDLIRTIHEQSAIAYCDGHAQGQKDLLDKLAKMGWDVTDVDLDTLDPTEVGRVPESEAYYDPSLDDLPAHAS